MTIACPNSVTKIAEKIRARGGRAIVVGGSVRDALLGHAPKDFDLEVFGLDMDTLESVLGDVGEVITVGRAFGVFRIKGIDLDVSVPRRDNKIGKRHRDFRVEVDPDMSFEDAARRRDLTINSIGYDPLTDEYLDPYDGKRDVEARLLRATDRTTFGEDPLRALRVAQFRARLEFDVDPELLELCRQADFADLSAERIYMELEKLFLKGLKPSLGFELLNDAGLMRFFPEAAAMIDCPQDQIWHPEGDVWVHTLMVMDEAAQLRIGDKDDDLTLMFSALCHDFGKPLTTFTDDEGRVRSPNHEREGVEPTRAFMERIRAPHDLTDRVAAIVQYHLAPALLPKQNARPKAYRRIARKLGDAGVTIELLVRLGRADHFGRTTPDALARDYSTGEEFYAIAKSLEIDVDPPKDVVMGRHLIARGMKPGYHFKAILEACREIQFETGLTDPDEILAEYARGVE